MTGGEGYQADALLRYRLLGPVEVLVGDEPVPLAGSRARNLLAALLLDAGWVVPRDRLIDLLWDEAPPRTAVTALQGVVSQLRRALRTDDGANTPIQLRPPGYAITVGPGELDLHEFECLVQAARHSMAAGRTARRAVSCVRRWRSGVDRPWGGVTAEGLRRAEVPRLEEMRLGALEDRIEADLCLGQHQSLVAELRSLVAAHPHRERLVRNLMLALYRCGRQADALDAYRKARRASVDELGLDFGPDLERLERAILRRDPTLDQPPVAPKPPRGPMIDPTPVPSGLPATVRDFTGRIELLTELRRLFTSGGEHHPGGPVIAALSGPPGVGKTALAVHVGHQVGDLFPDGQLYARLSATAPSPTEPGEVLRSWLRDLGLSPTAIPDDVEGRIRLCRACLVGRRLLVVIDDADSERAVRPLLPSGGGCAALVTSRTRLTGLEGATFLELDVLSPDQAVSLLGRIVGEERVAAEPEAAAAIVAACGYLPLAVRPRWPLSELAGRLRRQHRRLDELEAGDLTMRSSLDLSYAALGRTERRALRLVTALEVRDFTAADVSVLLDTEPSVAEKVLEHLADRHLLEASEPDPTGRLRYHLHDLLHEYAQERREQEDMAEAVAAARSRANRAYLTDVERAAGQLGGSIVPLPRARNRPGWEPPEPEAIDRPRPRSVSPEAGGRRPPHPGSAPSA